MRDSKTCDGLFEMKIVDFATVNRDFSQEPFWQQTLKSMLAALGLRE